MPRRRLRTARRAVERHASTGACTRRRPTAGPASPNGKRRPDPVDVSEQRRERRDPRHGSNVGDGAGSGGQPGGPMHWFRARRAVDATTVYPTVGLESAFYVGQSRVLRAAARQSNQSLDCEPTTGGQGHDFQMFPTGCDPWYTDNEFTGAPWWFPSPPGPPARLVPRQERDHRASRTASSNAGSAWSRPRASRANVIGGRDLRRDRKLRRHQQQPVSAARLQQPELLRSRRPESVGAQRRGAEPTRRLPVHRAVRRVQEHGSAGRPADPELRGVLHHRLARPERGPGDNPCDRSRPAGPRPAPDEPRTGRRDRRLLRRLDDPRCPGQPERRLRDRPSSVRASLYWFASSADRELPNR